jgi:putative tryptophan/tyrosine transport system substrate-binding protein
MRRMPRFAALLATFLAVAPAVAQTDDRIWRLGVLSPGESPAIRNVTLTELARQGFAEGRNLVVEERVGTTDRLPALARELVRTKPDAVIAVSNGAIRALREATKTIPIVMSFIGEDPVAAGIVTSLTRPGGNITGQVMLAPELDGKRLHLLHEAVPAARRIGVLAADPVRHKLNVEAMQQVAAASRLDVVTVYADDLTSWRRLSRRYGPQARRPCRSPPPRNWLETQPR